MNSNNSATESNTVESRDASDHEAPVPPQQISAFYEEAAGKKKKTKKVNRYEKVEVFDGSDVPTPPQLWEYDEEDPHSVDLFKKKIAYKNSAALLCSNSNDASNDASDDASNDVQSNAANNAGAVTPDHSDSLQERLTETSISEIPSAPLVRTQQGNQTLPPEDQGVASTGHQMATSNAGPEDQGEATRPALRSRSGEVSQSESEQQLILEATLVSSEQPAQPEQPALPWQAEVAAFTSQDPSSQQANHPAIVNALPMGTAAPFWKRRSTIFAFTSFLLSLALTVVLTLLISDRGVSRSGSTLGNTQTTFSGPTRLPTHSPSYSPTTNLTSATNIDPFQNQTSSRPPTFPPISTFPPLSPTANPTTRPQKNPISDLTASPTTMITLTAPTKPNIDCMSPLAFKQKLLPYDCSQCSPRTAMDQDYAVITDDDTVYFYNWNGTAWDKTQSVFIGTASDGSSMPVIMYGDDLTIVGIPAQFDIGAVYLFERNADTGKWTRFLRISPTDNTYYSEFGHSIGMDGNTMVVGAPNDREGQGSAFVYRRNANEFTLETKLAPDDPSLYRFGADIAINRWTIAVSDYEYGSDYKGAVFLYRHNSLHDSWDELKQTIINDDCDKWFGSSLAFMQDGGILIGCSWEDTQSGAVYYYAPVMQLGKKEVILQQKIVASDRIHYEKFGDVGTIAVDGNRMIVGTSPLFGSAYVFAQQGNKTWVEVMKVYGPDKSERFGQNVALSGRKFLVAAHKNAYSYTLENC